MPRPFYSRDAAEVGPELLNKLLVSGGRVARIVEVEAYRGSEDAASHAYRGPSRRNATMFGPPGHLYVYFSYGVHWCANAVCLPRGTAHAVLLRALAPIDGIEEMREARGGVPRDRDLCSGPGRLCQALGITGEHDGVDLVTGAGGVAIRDDGTPPPAEPGVGPRIGIRRAAELPLRFWVPGDVSVSRARPGPRPAPVRSSRHVG